MLSEGMTNAEIAAVRGVAVNSVERTVARLARALEIRDDGPGNMRVLLARAYISMARGGAGAP
jgi:DNA-binding NarL/FixJ family response regulator